MLEKKGEASSTTENAIFEKVADDTQVHQMLDWRVREVVGSALLTDSIDQCLACC